MQPSASAAEVAPPIHKLLEYCDVSCDLATCVVSSTVTSNCSVRGVHVLSVWKVTLLLNIRCKHSKEKSLHTHIVDTWACLVGTMMATEDLERESELRISVSLYQSICSSSAIDQSQPPSHPWSSLSAHWSLKDTTCPYMPVWEQMQSRDRQTRIDYVNVKLTW